MTATIRERFRSVPPLVWMVLIALALRLAVIPFDTIENLMDATHVHAWEQGNTERSDMLSQRVQIDAALETHRHEMPVVLPHDD